MMDFEEKVYPSVGLEGLKPIAETIASHLEKSKVWLFHGEMGAGKTTLIKEIGRVLRVDDAMSSPTFSIVNEYASAVAGKIYHFDFYRIRKEEEAVDIGTEEYFYSGYPCLVEWPERVLSLLPENFGEVTIALSNEKQRTITIRLHDGKEKNRL